jgi:hypothetical protein
MPEPDDGKLSRPVPRGREAGNGLLLPDSRFQRSLADLLAFEKRVGVSSLKEFSLSSRFSCFFLIFLLPLPWLGTYLLRRSSWLLFERSHYDTPVCCLRPLDELLG